MTKPLIVILAAVTLDAIGIGLIFPILPALLRDVAHVGEVSTLYGVILAIYAAMQFLFSPVLGMLSDRFGRRPVLLISLGGAASDYLLMSFAPELWMLVVGRAIAGITSANMAVATAYITDITPEAQRAQRFGYFHAMFGIGFIVGPVLGGWLGDWWVRAPFIAASLLNASNFALALFALPESHTPDRTARFSLRGLNPFGPLAWAAALAGLLPLLAIHFIFNFVGQIYGTVWVLFGEDRFHWDSTMVGLSLGLWGLLHAVVQMLLVGPIAKRVGERAAMIAGMACELTAYVITALATDGWIIFAIMPLYALGGLGLPALQSLATQQVDADKQGQLQGVMSSLMSVSAIFGPLFFSGLYFVVQPHWPGAIWLIGGAVYLLALPFMLSLRGKVRVSA